MAAQAELPAYLKQHMSEADAIKTRDELAGKLGLNSVSKFLGYVAILVGGLVNFWLSDPEWHQPGHAGRGILAHLRGMLNGLQRTEKQAHEAEDKIVDPVFDNLIAAKTNKTLTGFWLQAYGYRLHPTQEATNQILGSMWGRSQKSDKHRQIPWSGFKRWSLHMASSLTRSNGR